jgi:hypothetical protein
MSASSASVSHDGVEFDVFDHSSMSGGGHGGIGSHGAGRDKETQLPHDHDDKGGAGDVGSGVGGEYDDEDDDEYALDLRPYRDFDPAAPGSHTHQRPAQHQNKGTTSAPRAAGRAAGHVTVGAPDDVGADVNRTIGVVPGPPAEVRVPHARSLAYRQIPSWFALLFACSLDESASRSFTCLPSNSQLVCVVVHVFS